VAEKKSKTGKHQNVIWTVVSMKSLRREFDETSVKGKLNSAMWPVSDVRSSFPLDGGRPGWGCERDFRSPLPLSSPVKGEEIRNRTSVNRIRTHRRTNSIILFFVIGLLFVSTDASAQLKKIRLCAPGLGSGIMHAYVAKERGYFAQEGLDLDVLVARGQICTMALLNGQMELSSNPNIFDAMVAGRFKGKVIYVSAKTLGHRFIVAPEIKSFDGLKQKSIAVSTFGGLTDMLTREILEQHGINPARDVVLLQIGTPDVRYASLKAGTVRAALLASTQGLQAVKEGFRELPYQQPPWLSSPIVAGDELLARDRSMLHSLLRAIEKGHLYYGQNGTAAVALIQKFQRIENREIAKQIYDDDMLRHNPGGGLEDAAMRKVVERSREMLKVQRKVELSEIFDLSMAKEAEAELKKAQWEP
jgi:ABC-type nitrate/sulfonate/bicarbonate transport system substrate-binding protein